MIYILLMGKDNVFEQLKARLQVFETTFVIKFNINVIEWINSYRV